jgi:ferredoxin
MAIIITAECINCTACAPECPNNAIYEPGEQWTYAKGTILKEIEMETGEIVSAYKTQEAISNEVFYIVPNKCTECVGFHEEPQCASVCPVDCCVPDPDNIELEDSLREKKDWLHGS